MGRVPFSRYIVSFIYIYFAQNIYEKYTICISNSSTCQQHFMVVGGSRFIGFTSNEPFKVLSL